MIRENHYLRGLPCLKGSVCLDELFLIWESHHVKDLHGMRRSRSLQDLYVRHFHGRLLSILALSQSPYEISAWPGGITMRLLQSLRQRMSAEAISLHGVVRPENTRTWMSINRKRAENRRTSEAKRRRKRQSESTNEIKARSTR